MSSSILRNILVGHSVEIIKLKNGKQKSNQQVKEMPEMSLKRPQKVSVT